MFGRIHSVHIDVFWPKGYVGTGTTDKWNERRTQRESGIYRMMETVEMVHDKSRTIERERGMYLDKYWVPDGQRNNK